MLIALYLALAAGTTATTITKAKVFAPLRKTLKAKNSWLGYLVSCPYCVSHWCVFALQAIYRVQLVHCGVSVVDVAVTSMPMVGVSALVPAVLRRLYDFDADESPSPAPFKITDVDRDHSTISVVSTRSFEPGQLVDVMGS